ncbi:MAG: hydrogenase small subunit [Polyangiaceae bacterium]|jgi:hydrogenase small subunit|nr:hydrogenase small subunit [Polyangiaceae bacterium]
MDDSSREEQCPELGGVSRRAFMRFCASLVAALAVPGCSGEQAAEVLREAAGGKPAVLWLNGQDCNGCSIEFLNLDDDEQRGTPSIARVILEKISLRYHEALMAGSGHVAEQTKADVIASGGYILVVEGAIPGADDRYCVVGGASIREVLLEAARNAAFVIALGSCAATGGIVARTPTQGRPVRTIVTTRPVINLPMCPASAEHLLLTIVHLMTTNAAPELDEQGRPTMFFGADHSVHEACKRLPAFLQGKYLTDWNDPSQKDYCLVLRGCRGPVTRSDCSGRKFNGGVAVCTEVGSPCQGCAESSYYDGTPLYQIG